jgi:hypothetical protein
MEMNEQQALHLIEDMISKAKNELKDNGTYYLFWGWLVFSAAVINYSLLVFTDFEIHGLPWIILMPLGGIVSAFGWLKDGKQNQRVKTYVDDAIKQVIRAFVISILVVCITMPMGNQWRAFYPTLIVLYAIWLYISGGMLKFKPLIWGAVLNWILAAIGFIFPSTENHLILIALAVLGGYIIPGYMLKRKYKLDV